jgi:hypothetical protein
LACIRARKGDYWDTGKKVKCLSGAGARELERLLEPIYERATAMRDPTTVEKTPNILISLKRFLNRTALLENIPVTDQVDIK